LPCNIGKFVGDRLENFVEIVGEEWRLREQIEALEVWLDKNRHKLDPKQKWVADIGFCVRKNAMGGGPPITRELMQMCLEMNLEIYLSEYPGEA